MNNDLRTAIATDIPGWDAIDDHRTGTIGDHQTSDWLAENVRAVGLTPYRDDFDLSRWVLHHFDLSRWVLHQCSVAADGRMADGVPLFDGGVTGPAGTTGPLRGWFAWRRSMRASVSAPLAARRGPRRVGPLPPRAGRTAVRQEAAWWRWRTCTPTYSCSVRTRFGAAERGQLQKTVRSAGSAGRHGTRTLAARGRGSGRAGHGDRFRHWLTPPAAC